MNEIMVTRGSETEGEWEKLQKRMKNIWLIHQRLGVEESMAVHAGTETSLRLRILGLRKSKSSSS